MAADALSRAPVKNSDVRAVSTGDEEDDVLVIIQAKQWEAGELSQIIN